MREAVTQRLKERMQSYADLIAQIDDAALNERLDIPKHKTIKEHLWCIVGARESYARAIHAGQWQGFACSMNSYHPDDFTDALESSSNAVLDAIQNVPEWTEARNDLLVALAEHEVMHEGQLIRHIYGVKRVPPKSFRWA